MLYEQHSIFGWTSQNFDTSHERHGVSSHRQLDCLLKMSNFQWEITLSFRENSFKIIGCKMVSTCPVCLSVLTAAPGDGIYPVVPYV